MWGTPPSLNVIWEADVHKVLAQLANERLIKSASDLSDGGLICAIAKASFQNQIGVDGDVIGDPDSGLPGFLFAEDPSSVLVSCGKSNVHRIREIAAPHEIQVSEVGKTALGKISISIEGSLAVNATIAELQEAYSNALESQLAAEVVTA